MLHRLMFPIYSATLPLSATEFMEFARIAVSNLYAFEKLVPFTTAVNWVKELHSKMPPPLISYTEPDENS